MRPDTHPDMRPDTRSAFEIWFAALEQRHLSLLTFQEIRRGLQALSSIYVERRRLIESGDALKGEGKRAAFALFYGPLHFLLVGAIVRDLGCALPPPARILDLGCGTAASSAAWALEAGGKTPILGIDRNAWAVEEARWTLHALKVRGEARKGEIDRPPVPGPQDAVLLAFAVNELGEPVRARLLDRLLRAAEKGTRVLVVEPLARRPMTWWDGWSKSLVAAGGRDDLWRIEVDLPDRLRLLDKATGLDHRKLTGRSLWLSGTKPRPTP
jgi:SAM-dependent methyltransferase